MTRKNTAVDLWLGAEPVGECLVWHGHKNSSGYGVLSWKGLKSQLAHRVAYQLVRGQIPDGLVIDHLCRVRACINPFHMEVVDNRTNLVRGDGFPGVNARRTHCKNGHEFTEANTYITYRGGRACRACNLARVNAKNRSARKAALATYLA